MYPSSQSVRLAASSPGVKSNQKSKQTMNQIKTSTMHVYENPRSTQQWYQWNWPCTGTTVSSTTPCSPPGENLYMGWHPRHAKPASNRKTTPLPGVEVGHTAHPQHTSLPVRRCLLRGLGSRCPQLLPRVPFLFFPSPARASSC